jgi:hypothetical protein
VLEVIARSPAQVRHPSAAPGHAQLAHRVALEPETAAQDDGSAHALGARLSLDGRRLLSRQVDGGPDRRREASRWAASSGPAPAGAASAAIVSSAGHISPRIAARAIAAASRPSPRAGSHRSRRRSTSTMTSGLRAS